MARVKHDNWVRIFDITDPKKHKNGFTVYKVTSVVFPKSAPEACTKVIVWKRFNDFKKLYKKIQNYLKQCKINEELPELCKAKYFKRFEENVIKDRINFALELLNFIGRHQILFTSDLFLQFFNNGYHISEITNANDGNSKMCLNANNSNFTSKLNSNLKRDGSIKNSKSSRESVYNNFEGSDDSNIMSDTPSSISPTHSIDSLTGSKISNALDVVDSPRLIFEERMEQLNECKELLSHGEVVTCHSEKPMGVCLSVRTEDFRSNSEMLCPGELSEEWVTPPDTPAGRQDYLVEAAYHVGQAQKYEVDGEYEAAFCFYKAAIACLLSGVQDDDDKLRRQAVKEKTNQYLQRAEKIYALHLAPEREPGPERMPEMEELKLYKVVGVIDSVMLVLNTTDGNYYVIKALQKSSCPVNKKRKTIIPYNVPYMVKLHKYFENEDSIFLVLEYASRGKLWDHLDDFTLVKKFSNEFYSSLSNSFNHELMETPETRKENLKNFNNSEPLLEMNLTDDLRNKKANLSNLEVDNLLENSQKLLHSVNRTLQKSEKLTSSLNKELSDIEFVFDLKCQLMAPEGVGFRKHNGKKRSRSVALRQKLEKCYSSEDLSDSRPRTASSSVDRRNEWSESHRIPESTVRAWASELLIALETLHRWGIICKDLHPGNILMGDGGHILLTFQADWRGVDFLVSGASFSGLYAAPETASVFPITPAADWWSFGALLHDLLTGKTLSSCYPEGILGHTILTFPDNLSPEACSLLRELLRFEPGERLGSGVNGAEEIKCHPFFSLVDWRLVYSNC